MAHKNRNNGDGADFIETQRAMDKATNERTKSETGDESLDPEQVNRRKAERKPEVSIKVVSLPVKINGFGEFPVLDFQEILIFVYEQKRMSILCDGN
jgi:hypothetical protein